MWTKKTRFVLIYFKVAFFAVPIILPMRCAHEIIEGWQDFFAPFRFISDKVYSYLKMAEEALLLIKEYEPFDLVDMDVTGKDEKGRPERVKIKIMTR